MPERRSTSNRSHRKRRLGAAPIAAIDSEAHRYCTGANESARRRQRRDRPERQHAPGRRPPAAASSAIASVTASLAAPPRGAGRLQREREAGPCFVPGRVLAEDTPGSRSARKGHLAVLDHAHVAPLVIALPTAADVLADRPTAPSAVPWLLSA